MQVSTAIAAFCIQLGAHAPTTRSVGIAFSNTSLEHAVVATGGGATYHQGEPLISAHALACASRRTVEPIAHAPLGRSCFQGLCPRNRDHGGLRLPDGPGDEAKDRRTPLIAGGARRSTRARAAVRARSPGRRDRAGGRSDDDLHGHPRRRRSDPDRASLPGGARTSRRVLEAPDRRRGDPCRARRRLLRLGRGRRSAHRRAAVR